MHSSKSGFFKFNGFIIGIMMLVFCILSAIASILTSEYCNMTGFQHSMTVSILTLIGVIGLFLMFFGLFMFLITRTSQQTQDAFSSQTFLRVFSIIMLILSILFVTGSVWFDQIVKSNKFICGTDTIDKPDAIPPFRTDQHTEIVHVSAGLMVTSFIFMVYSIGLVYYTFGETEKEKLKRLQYLNQEFRAHPNTASEDKLKQLEELTDSLRDNDFETQEKQDVSTGASNITIMRANIAKAKEAEKSAYASSIKAKQVVDYVQDYINNEGNEENIKEILDSICINPNKESIIRELKTKVNGQELKEMIDKSDCKEIKDIFEAADKRKEKEKEKEKEREDSDHKNEGEKEKEKEREDSDHKHEGEKLSLSPATPPKGNDEIPKSANSIPPLEPQTPQRQPNKHEKVKTEFKSKTNKKRRV